MRRVRRARRVLRGVRDVRVVLFRTRARSKERDEETREAKGKRIAAELTEKHGLKDGRPPCPFHYGPNKKCRFDAAT